MNPTLDEMKRQAKALASALGRTGAAKLSPTQAFDAVARMHGLRDWRAALAAGGAGSWNASQLTIHRAFPDSARLVAKEGGTYLGRGNGLYEALMHLARSQPYLRLLKTLAHWADEVDGLQQAVRDAMLIDDPYAPRAIKLPKGLAATFTGYLAGELYSVATSSWVEMGGRLERLRMTLYAVQAALMATATCPSLRAVMTLESLHSTALVIGVPLTVQGDAAALAERVISTIHARTAEVADGLFVATEAEIKVRLVQAGFALLAPSMSGPIWD